MFTDVASVAAVDTDLCDTGDPNFGGDPNVDEDRILFDDPNFDDPANGLRQRLDKRQEFFFSNNSG